MFKVYDYSMFWESLGLFDINLSVYTDLNGVLAHSALYKFILM